MQILTSLHTSIVVTDLEKAEHFYSEVLRLVKIERIRKHPGAWYQVGDNQLHIIVDLNAPRQPKHEKWGRNPHVAFSVSDLDAAKKQLSHYNFPFQLSDSGRLAIFTQDPDGNIIELSGE
jgi:catechol-2,3-dioxygenase